MPLNTSPGLVGYKAFTYSSLDGKAMAKFTDANHLSTLTQHDGPTEYDRAIIDIWTQTASQSEDFIAMINKSTPFYIDNDEWTWKVRKPYTYPRLVSIPASTTAIANKGVDGQTFEIVLSDNYFQVNDIITADRWRGDKLAIVDGPTQFDNGYLYKVVLTGVNITADTAAQERYLTVGTQYDKVDNVVGEYDLDLSGLPRLGDYIQMYEGLSAGYGVEHSVTKWADSMNPAVDSQGRPLDIVVYDSYRMNTQGKLVAGPSRWEPFVERKMRDEMMRIRKHRYLFGAGGEMNTLGRRQENKRISEGIISKMRNSAHYVPLSRGEFSLNLLRDLFGVLFYNRVPMDQRKVKLYTNESGMRLFRQANKRDLMESGITIIADQRFIEGSGQNMGVNFGFNRVFTMETGWIEVSHLMELDQPELNSEFGPDFYAAPIFIAFDVSNANSGGLTNIREVRQKGMPMMEWGYIDGRRSHLGPNASRGMQSSSKFPGYQIWMEDRSDIFIEDLSKCVFIESLPYLP